MSDPVRSGSGGRPCTRRSRVVSPCWNAATSSDTPASETVRTAPFAGHIAIGLVGVAVLAWWWAGKRLPLLATSVLAAAIAVTGRLLLPITIDHPTPFQLIHLDWWVATAAGIGCLLGLLHVRGAAGLGQALAAAPVAALLTAAITLAFVHLPEVPRPQMLLPLALR